MSAVVAERYADALFEVGEESGRLAEFTQEIARFSAAYSEHSELRNALSNPVVSETQRDEIIRDVANRLNLSPLATNAVRLVAKRRRLSALAEIALRLVSLADDRTGVVRATVVTAKAFPESFYEQLSREIAGATSRRVKIERRVDASLIAGVITTIGDNTIDGSLRGRLDDVQQRLTTTG